MAPARLAHALRNATSDDVPIINTLLKELVEHHLQIDPRAWSPSHISPVHSWIETKQPNDSQVLILATVDNEVVGFLRGFIKSAMGGFGHDRCGLITHLVVTKAFRHNGLGKSMVMHATEEFRSEGADEICASAYLKNESALAFWKSVGMAPLTVTMQAPL